MNLPETVTIAPFWGYPMLIGGEKDAQLDSAVRPVELCFAGWTVSIWGAIARGVSPKYVCIAFGNATCGLVKPCRDHPFGILY